MKPLGLTGNHFLLLDFAGIERLFPASVLHSRDGLLDLFGGQAWLLEHFPKKAWVRGDKSALDCEQQRVTIGFRAGAAAEWLIEACHAAQSARGD